MLFQKNVVKKYFAPLERELVARAWSQYESYFLNAEIQENIRQSKEEQFQEGFLRELFVKVLGYTLNPSPDYNLITEQKNETDSKKADGAILKEGKVIGVIELKDHKTSDLTKVEPQVFNYKSQHPEARLVIISNFEKLRLYIDNAVEHREWNLFKMTEDEFGELYLCLAWPQVERGVAIEIKQESVSNEDQITKALYKDYSQFKRALFEDIVKNNPAGEGVDVKEWQLRLFKKTQKLLDRLLFIFFAEDSGLLPPNSMVKIIEQWEKLKELDEYKPLYSRVKKYFGYLDTGHKFKNYELFAYNGGLFKPDEVLDRIEISDEVLVRHTRKLSEYDFESEVDVNILGHIFENSLSEIEAVNQQISNGEAPQTSKRKQDGVFYTPQYITKYIVENTVGRLCTEKKQELGIVEEEYFSDKNRRTDTKKRLMERLQAYREWLLGLTILDPACGSGAFLNAALQFLMAEHSLIDEMEAKLTGASIVFQGVENSILENNLYGVDINEESVEIAQLALWLRTAKPHRKLNTLSGNIKCGNSLISDPAVAGEKAFDWEKEFPQVFEKGGFDVVIGNPPYFNIQTLGAKSKQVEYIQQEYSEIWQDKSDILFYFIYKAMQISKGDIGFIVSNAFLFSDKAQKLRNKILDDGRLSKIVNFEQYMVFADASISSCITIFNKEHQDRKAIVLKEKHYSINEVADYISDAHNEFSVKLEKENVYALVDNRIASLNKKIDNSHPQLQDVCFLGKGMETAADNVFLFDNYPEQFPKEFVKKRITGKNMDRYLVIPDDIFVLYYEDIDCYEDLPQSVQEYLKNNKDILENRATCKNEGRTWWRYSRPMHKEYYNLPKLYCSRRAFNNTFCYDDGFDYLGFSNMTVVFETDKEYSIKYILSLLNSRLLNFRYKSIGKQTGGGSFEYFPNGVGKLPIPDIQSTDQQPFINLADTMLTLNAQLQEKRSRFHRRLVENFEGVKITTALQTFDQLDFKAFADELKKQKIKLSLAQQDEWEEYFGQYKQACNDLSSQITATDKEIDAKVYQLYGLTEEEIKTVEAS